MGQEDSFFFFFNGDSFDFGGLRVEPRVVETFSGRGSLLGNHLQHGQQEVGEVSGVLVRPPVLLHQDVEQGPGFEFGDVP